MVKHWTGRLIKTDENRISKGEIDMGKKNKPRWKNLNMYERLARRCKQCGGSEEWVEWLHQKAREKECMERKELNE